MRHSSVVVLWWTGGECLVANPHDGDYVLRLLGIYKGSTRAECLVLIINEALVGTCGIYGIQPYYVCMSRSVVETIVGNHTDGQFHIRELLKWQNFAEPLRRLWQTSSIYVIGQWAGSAWKGRCRHLPPAATNSQWVFQTSVDVTLLLLLVRGSGRCRLSRAFARAAGGI
jgi:hypothetical protein